MSEKKVIYLGGGINNDADIVIRPAFIPLPRSGKRCPFTSMTRKALEELILPSISNNYRPQVKCKELSDVSGNVQRRLINYESLMDFMRALPEPEVETGK